PHTQLHSNCKRSKRKVFFSAPAGAARRQGGVRTEMPRERRSYPASPQTPPLRWLKNICLGCALEGGWELRPRQKIRCAFWRERRAGRCKAPRRRRCGGIVEERQRRRCPPAAAPLRAAARRPAGCVARSLHTAAGMLVARALPAGLGASSKMYTLFPDGPLVSVVRKCAYVLSQATIMKILDAYGHG